MTPEEKEIQIALGTYLQTMWVQCCKDIEHSYELGDYGDTLQLCAEITFTRAVREIYGENIDVNFAGTSCELSNGISFSHVS